MLELSGLANGAKVHGIARLEPEARRDVGLGHEREVFLLDEVQANEQPHLPRAHRPLGERLEELPAPGLLHSEERVGDEERPLREVEEAIQPVHLLIARSGSSSARRRRASPAPCRRRSRRGSRARGRSRPAKPPCGRRADSARGGPVVGIERVGIGNGLRTEDARERTLAARQRLASRAIGVSPSLTTT